MARHRRGRSLTVWRVARGALFADAFASETGETPNEAAAHAWQVYRRWTSWIPVVTSASSLWVGIMALALVAFLARRRKRWRRRRQWDQEAGDAWQPAKLLERRHARGWPHHG